MTQKSRLLRNAFNIAWKCNLHPDLEAEPCRAAFKLALALAWKCSPHERRKAAQSCSNPDGAAEQLIDARVFCCREAFEGESCDCNTY